MVLPGSSALPVLQRALPLEGAAAAVGRGVRAGPRARQGGPPRRLHRALPHEGARGGAAGRGNLAGPRDRREAAREKVLG